MRRIFSIIGRLAIDAVALVVLAQSLAAQSPAAQSPAAQATAPAIRPLAYTRVVLKNGLVALFNEDHSSPTVVVDVWYHIGSKDDKPGRTGLAHFCEHVMGQGSPHIDQPQSIFYQSLGGTSPHSANTTEDITHFYVSVPSSALETVLWAESDRMAVPLARADSATVAGARAVITREREQNVENFPFGVYRELTIGALFPEGHPYHLVPLPPVADLYGATANDLEQACLPYYVPNNAVVSISGDFDTKVARGWVEHYFGTIKRGAEPAHAALTTPTLPSDKRLVLEDPRANQPRIHFAWVGAAFAAPDRLALNAIGSLLTLPRFGRLTKLLVDERKLATNVLGGNSDLEKSGVFELIVFPRPGSSLSTIETLVDSVIAGLSTSPIAQREIDRFSNYNADSAVTWLQTRFARADTLAHGDVFAHDPVAYAKQVNAARALTPAQVQRAAAQYLATPHVVFSLVPAGKLELISKPELPYTNVTPAASGVRQRRP
jgi:zinc protease